MSAVIPWQTLSEIYGFVGNSLLKPMTQTSSVGLDPEFWAAFPHFDAQEVVEGVDACRRYAQRAAELDRAEALTQAAVEYTRLFVGPPSPAAPPWETLYRGDGVTKVGFGQATFEMRELLREAGLELQNENHQYEDHLGIELLYLSELCRRCALDESSGDDALITAFIEQHPLLWIKVFRDRVDESAPDGYFAGLLQLMWGVLEYHKRL